jgi:hypothetical protein
LANGIPSLWYLRSDGVNGSGSLLPQGRARRVGHPILDIVDGVGRVTFRQSKLVRGVDSRPGKT